MKEIIAKIVVALLLVATLYLVGLAFVTGLEKQDWVQCQKLKSQSQEYPLFYLTQNEKDMCDSLGVTISAPINTYEN